MEGLGFIHEKLDIKILILYILNHLPAANRLMEFNFDRLMYLSDRKSVV